ncbi:MAG TPA: hypothetical protein VGN08_04180 [Solirubrobacteraceae bacterium]
MLALTGSSAPVAMSAGLNPGNAFSELAGGGQETPTTPKPKTTTSSTSPEPTNSHTVALLALGAAVVVLCGIAFVIARDARKVAPAGDLDALERGSARDSAARLRRRRAKAKAARQQRKRNR